MMRLPGTRALVTGGSSGIGLATARLLASAGCAVTVVGSDPDRVASATGAVTGAGEVCDFADAAAVSALAARLAEQGAFDLVVHSAGIGLRGPASATGAGDLDALLAVNVRAPILLTSALLPAMTARGSGRLVFVGSIAGAVGAAGESSYAASKAALHAYADSLLVELAGTGVGVTTVLPGVVDTPFFTRRGVPYHRGRPRPVPPARVARAIVRAVRRDRSRVTVPGWLRLPVALHAALPQSFGRLASRWGR
jgi:short-subunit dehydrogenase